MSIRGRLEAIASNLWWCWNPHAQALFQRIDPEAWEKTNHSPLAVLRNASEAQLAETYAAPDALDALDAVQTDLHRYLGGEGTWVRRETPEMRRGLVAYFCAEFGIHESLPLYSGGLGVLAGDHIKTASDVGVPFVGIGLKYPEGYFQQSVDAEGWQQERYPPTDWSSIPAELVSHGGQPLIVDMPISDRTVYAQVWKLEVGRATLYLLDTNVPQNNAEDRSIGGRLYSGGSETRIRQEIVLGVGGVRLLRALKLDASVYHLNEGHSAFACLELMREHIDEGASFDEALGRVRAKTLFTTHTPVPAGHDRFAPDLVQVMLWRLQQGLKVDWRTFLGMGRVNLDNPNETFCMTVLALKCAAKANGVSALHGAVSREMWREMWPGWSVHDVPIGHVTNGIHVESFMHPTLRSLLDERFGDRWQHALHDDEGWAALIDTLSDDEIVSLKRALKQAMFGSLKQRLYTFGDDYGPDTEWQMGALANWQTDVLTIGFARRFATYKRGAMLFDEFERAVELIANADRPMQIIYAGKAHPKDIPGKEVIQRVIKAARDPRLKGRVLFMENYDMSVARSMISGVDVWLNTPRRPREASGTSGQKVNMHAGVNCSILDGWWGEGFDDRNGFAIGDREVPQDPAEQDRRDRAALYGVLEGQVVPEYYAGTTAGTGEAWVARMRGSMRTLPAQFSTRRMLADYIRQFYAPITAG